MLNWPQCPVIESDPERVHGAWVLKGTRLPASVVFENLARGATIDDIVSWYGGISKEDVAAVVDFVAASLEAEAEAIARSHADTVRS
jgi:uncharacterized protein (DUF433 family)